MRTFAGAALLLSFAYGIGADTREVTKITFAGRETIVAQYVQGKKTRTENLSANGSPQPVRIWNLERNTLYELDLQSQEYAERGPRSADWIVLLAQWIAPPPRIRESGKMVNVYYETIDTGESREFFGHTAKHLIMRERRVAEAGACGFTHQIEKDGWYIPPGKPVAGKSSYWLAASHFGALSLNGVICHDTVVTHGVASLPGFPVFEADGEVTREVLELSNNPLDKSLFEVPNGFKKVDALPGEPWFPGPTVCEWNGKNWSGLSNLDSINFESIAWFGSYSAVKV